MTTWMEYLGEGADQGAHQRPHARRSAVGDLQLLRPGGLRAAATSTATATAQEAHRHSVRERRSRRRPLGWHSSTQVGHSALAHSCGSGAVGYSGVSAHARATLHASEFALRGSDYSAVPRAVRRAARVRQRADPPPARSVLGVPQGLRPYSEYPRACVSTRSTVHTARSLSPLTAGQPAES